MPMRTLVNLGSWNPRIWSDIDSKEIWHNLSGGHISPILVASEKIGIRIVDTRHEVTAVFAADAVSRLSGTVGVACVTAGPGLTNTVTAVKNAQMAESPVLLMGGAAASLLKGRGALQDIDQMALFKPLCKYCATVTKVRDIVPTIRAALRAAQSGTPGPVFIEFPIDVLYPYKLVARELGAKPDAKGVAARIVGWYLRNHLGDLFAGAWEERDATPLPVERPFATPREVAAAARLVANAKRPLLLVGSQSMLPPTSGDELRAAVEAIGVPCYLSGMSRGLLGRDSAIQMRQRRRDALKEADVILLVGTVCDFRLGYGRVLGRRAAIIAVNRDRAQLLRNSDLFWKPTLAVRGDPGSFLVTLAAELRGRRCDDDWLQRLRERDRDVERRNALKADEKVDAHLNPIQVLMEMEVAMADDAVVVADGGDFVGTAAYVVRPRGPLCWLDPGAFGTLGVGGGFALGAKLCRPDSEVWIVYGDGSAGYSIAEFDTFTRHGVPVLAIVGNDAGWTQISREQVPIFGSNVACALDYLDYDKIAEGYGARGFKMDAGDINNISMIFAAAQQEYKKGKSVCINALIGKTDFREGSISV
ncbi:PREDICTED: acetolactate synthase-like protein isoform X2 [Priapulus caudatus]|uniref:2-hydroxyacyl-CoA lyase 2 n=1 Tax=Priapulus caudatus TaxID=37621 RepID=A0ABM1ES63_PRICU|nr:PREDICTED: acetolactate synthase-like protein isoform X2 [Priapulus caudatus]